MSNNSLAGNIPGIKSFLLSFLSGREGEKGGGRGEEEGEDRLLCTCPAPDHLEMPRCWPPCW